MADARTDVKRRPTQVVLPEALHLLALVALIAGVATLLWIRAEVRVVPTPSFTSVRPPPPPGTPPADCGPERSGGRPIVLDMVFSEEKRAWIEEASTLFARRCPNIQVRLTAMGDIAAAQAILAGAVTPTLWSPNDSLVADYLTHQWRARSQEPPFVGEPVSLVRSPLVLLLWEEERRVYAEIRERTAATEGMWSQLMCALVPPDPPADAVAPEDRIPGDWLAWYDEVVRQPARGEPANTGEPELEPVYTAPFPSDATIAGWGRVKIGHASPSHTAAGLATIYLMAFERVLPPNLRPAVDELASDHFPEGPVLSSTHLAGLARTAFAEQEGALTRWFTRCEGGLDDDPQSVELLTETMFNVGDERYDGVATYEHLVFPLLARLAGNVETMRDLTVVYPPVTIVNDHPALLLSRTSELQTIAAKLWLEFLREEPMQRRAIELGFRPANPAVKIRDYHTDTNPFLDYRRFGIQFDQPLTEPPRLGGELVTRVLEIWRDATGRS